MVNTQEHNYPFSLLIFCLFKFMLLCSLTRQLFYADKVGSNRANKAHSHNFVERADISAVLPVALKIQ